MYRPPTRIRNIRRIKKLVCRFCEKKMKPDYKTPPDLVNFLSERGKILSRDKTGVCPKHQRKLVIAIKRARHLALLPFVSGI